MGYNFEPSLPLLLILLLLCTTAPSSTDAWGWQGHKLICKIAESRLGRDARAAVNMVLDGRMLEEVCSWADEDTARQAYPWTKPLHYANTPSAREFNYDRDCGDGDCVVAAILQYEEDLRANHGRLELDNMHQPQPVKLNETLMFLAHFMGDIHQPLHVGFTRDNGGTLKDVICEGWGGKMDLHDVWDTQIIRTALQRLYHNRLDIMLESIERRMELESPVAILGPHRYASESAWIAYYHAYKFTPYGRFIPSPWPGFPIPTLRVQYYRASIRVVEDRIAAAGVRLGDLLNGIFGQPESPQDQEEY